MAVDEHATDRFLRTGTLDGASPAEIAEACLQRVRAATTQSNRVALKLGQQFVRQARPHGGVLYTTALRANGWAQLVAGAYPQAEQDYLEARRLLRRDALARARIDRILIDIYMYLDRPKESKRRARLALDTFRRLDAAADTAKTQVNYANVLHRQDRHREAGRLYRKAADFFADAGVEPAAALCWYNLANTRVQLFDFEEAEDLYTRARDIFTRCDDLLHATGCLYGLAWLHMLAGEFHKALRELSACEKVYRKGGQQRELLLCLLDRAETFLSLNLLTDARRTAEEAGRHARRLRLGYESAKADLFAGRASVGLGRSADARRALTRAADSFKRVRNESFAAATRLSLAQATGDARRRSSLLISARRSFRKAQLPLWQAICDLQMLSDRPDDPATWNRLSRNPAVRTVPHLFVGWQTLRGDRAFERRRVQSARVHWARAADTLDAVRVKLPPVEMRSAYMRKRPDPFARLIEVDSVVDPARAAAWSERSKTGGIWSAPQEILAASPQRRQIEADLAELAQRVAAVAGTVTLSGSSRTLGTAHVDRTLRSLQTTLRNRLAELDVSSSNAEPTETVAQQLVAESQRQPIVQFYVGADDITVFVHHRGDCHSHRYTDGVQTLSDLVSQWRFLIECAAYTPGEASGARLRDEQEALDRISRWLLPPLEIPNRTKRLLIIPEGPLVNLPWLALQPNGSRLGDDRDIVLTPSLRHYHHARRNTSRGRQMRVFVGDRQGLTHIDSEIDAIRARLPEAHTEIVDPCSRSDWPGDGQSHIWHYSGHASLRSDNPFYSALMLADGPLFAADLRLLRHRVSLVTLAACRTGQRANVPGDENTGLVRSLLEMGARNVVASHWAVADRSTAAWMDRFYCHYLGGAAVSRAVRLAARDVRETYPSVYHWGAFSAFGCG